MSEQQEAMNKPQRQFQFIDNSTIDSNKHSATQIRRHVMQEVMRDKRWKARAKDKVAIHGQELLVEESVPRSEPILETRRVSKSRKPQRRPREISKAIGLSSQHSKTITSDRSQTVDVTQSSTLETCILPTTDKMNESVTSKTVPPINTDSFAVLVELFPTETPSPTQTITSGSLLSTPESLKDSLVSPKSILSAARTDPFDVLPMKLNVRDQELFDFYATVMPSCSYGFEKRSPKAHNWYRDVFIPEGMKGAVTFQNTVLVHAANTQAWVMKLTETPLSLEHRDRASSLLSEHYRLHPDDTSDAVITATMSAAALEDFDPRQERRPIAWMHWAAAMHKIRQKGGPACLESTPSLRKLINWQDYIFSGYDGRGSSFLFTPDALFMTSDEDQMNAYGTGEIHRQCEEFLTFLSCTEHLASVASTQLENAVVRKQQPLRYSIFVPGHPLYDLLAGPNEQRYTESGQLKQIISRLAALMTINVVIWEYRLNTSYSEAFLHELIESITNNELHKNVSVEALIQILLGGNDKPLLWHFERPWLVGRLLKVAKRLSRSSWEQLNNFLLSCLTLGGVRPSGTKMQAWEEDLRDEILRAPLVSYQLPLMQS